ncbi:mitochondrial thiamine pyrophosphate carrier 1 [Aspergillus udagawae]|uniref:Mitochondrial thiamine pyrophosphate carrier 1 n=1 Tax=Aspergillus udagawae TaxID=91492 RepID=A0A8E0QKF1_9EURO|nr:mitochondrial thiamine pyrophosphate transporter [Aspergillus udagawae]GFF47416.1 mitochondrial thiamine pyrophosphate carrier 1 [Aspergillus udagawae]GFF53379.1 mitochondrial thiamine pyrophosphate carrier 1 [Aspergillus udagawae]GFF79469.1 mitochondrial thiamine pyrophosphate carrier 1 [Aspergillus udagawae]GFG11409.1 mitochondrial thiamine pyrophosphate carrier 1 [Aspergillus udagawae]GFG23303.1 mitochondrial thiamine pyrophosphate carrier 1 [Aspergillus udagawae]
MSAGGEHLKDEGTRRQVVLSGGIAGLVSRFCVAPLDVVKIRLQLQVHSLSDPASHRDVIGPIYKGTLSTMRAILKQEGITGLWKGNIPAELMYVCYGALQFTAYRTTTQLLAQLDPHRLPPALESFVSGAVAGGLATASTYPLDLLRTRFAAQGTERIYTSLLGSVQDIARNEGPAGFFRGCSAAIGQIVPYMGLFFATYESLRPVLSGQENMPFGSGDAAAGVIASVLAKTGVFPLDLVRKRLQVQGPTRTLYVHRNIPEYRGVFSTIAMIVRTQGVRGLYRGLTVSLIKAAPASAITMWTYERSLKLLHDFRVAE